MKTLKIPRAARKLSVERSNKLMDCAKLNAVYNMQ